MDEFLFYLRFGSSCLFEATWQQQFFSIKIINIEVGFLKITLTKNRGKAELDYISTYQLWRVLFLQLHDAGYFKVVKNLS